MVYVVPSLTTVLPLGNKNLGFEGLEMAVLRGAIDLNSDPVIVVEKLALSRYC